MAGSVVGTLGAIIYSVNRAYRQKAIETRPLLSIAVICVLLVSPVTTPPHILVLIVPLFFLFTHLHNRSCSSRLLVVLGYLSTMLGYSPRRVLAPFFSGGIWNAPHDGVVAGMIILLWICLRAVGPRVLGDDPRLTNAAP